MKIEGRLIVFSVLFIFLFSIVSATVVFDSSSLSVKKNYNIGERLSGSVKLTLHNESSQSLLYTNLGSKKVKIADWLNQAGKRKGIDYNCSSYNCVQEYSIVQEVGELEISSEQSKVIGFKIIGDNVRVLDLSFEANTDLPNSCSSEFLMEVAEKQDKILKNYRYTEPVCGDILKGCFDDSLSSDMYIEAQLTDNKYCEKINLYPAPAYSFSSNLTKIVENKYEKVTYELYDQSFGVKYGECSVNLGIGNCIIPYPINKENEYNVCVYSNVTTSNYRIRTEQTGNKCGRVGINAPQSVDFDIYATALSYSNSQGGKILFDEDKFALLNNEENITSLINSYLEEKYNLNCTEGCYIPFRIVGDDQTMTITNPSLTYESNGLPITQNKIYEIEEKYPSLDTYNLQISFDSAEIPITLKNNILQINLGKKILSRSEVQVSTIPVSIKPYFALIGIETEFLLDSNITVSSATWKFSDEPAKVYSTKNVKRTFSKQGNYSVNVNVVTSQGTYNLNQQIIVGDPKESAEKLMTDSEKKIENIASGMNSLPQWIKQEVDNKLNVIVLNNSIRSIKEKLAYASNDSEYLEVIEQINSLNIPNSFGIIRTGKFPLISTYNNLNVDYVEEIYGEKQANQEQTRSSILEWTRDNFDSEIELITYGINTADGNEALLTKVNINLVSKQDSNNQRYLIIDYPLEAIEFKQGYSQKEIQSGTYIPVSEESEIEFYVQEDMSIENLGVYIMPQLSELQKQGYTYEIVSSGKAMIRKVVYISLTVILLFVIFATILLQYWYRNNYEKHLFEKEENLFNIMTFIYNSKKNNLKEGDIRKNLLSSGWTREQISYALGKFEGKILGLFGLPIYSARQEKRNIENIENKQRQISGRKVY